MKEPVKTSTQSSIKVNTIFCINVEFISRHLLVILRDNKGSPLGIPENHFPSNNNLKEKKPTLWKPARNEVLKITTFPSN